MPAGPLRDRVRFERRSKAEDGYGNTVAGWEFQFDRAAEIRPLKGGEDVIAARLTGRQPALIIVRSDSLTRQITPDWRVIDIRYGATYAVHGAADMERRREWITLVCEAGVAP